MLLLSRSSAEYDVCIEPLLCCCHWSRACVLTCHVESRDQVLFYDMLSVSEAAFLFLSLGVWSPFGFAGSARVVTSCCPRVFV